jgi:hypothetical protein
VPNACPPGSTAVSNPLCLGVRGRAGRFNQPQFPAANDQSRSSFPRRDSDLLIHWTLAVISVRVTVSAKAPSRRHGDTFQQQENGNGS